MDWNRKWTQTVSSMPALLLLSLFFVLGVFLGQVVFCRAPDAAAQELKHYLSDFLLLESTDGLFASTVLCTLALYFRYPLLAILFGFAVSGIVLLPMLTVAFGFFLSFAVSCFTAAFGKAGILLAVAILGLRCLVSIPCYFLVAVPAWRRAAAYIRWRFRRNSKASLQSIGRRPPWRFWGAIGLALLLGGCLDFYLSPWLLRYSLQQVFL